MNATSVITILSLAEKVLKVLIPIAREIYEYVNDKSKPEFTRENAPEKVIEAAKKNGKNVGHTEAKMAIDAVHLAKAKVARINALDGSRIATAAKPKPATDLKGKPITSNERRSVDALVAKAGGVEEDKEIAEAAKTLKIAIAKKDERAKKAKK